MATFGISMANNLAQQLDDIAARWYTSRSGALTRIFLEWQQYQSQTTDAKQSQTNSHYDRPQDSRRENSCK